MAITRLSTATCGDCANAIKSRIDAGAGPGLIRVYDGALPATPETAITVQVLLGTLTLSDPCGTVTDKTLNFAAIAQDIAADTNGVIGFCRVTDSNGNVIVDGDASTVLGTGMFKFNTTTVVAGGPIAMTSGSITVG